MIRSQEVCKEVEAKQQSSEGQVHWLTRQQQCIPHDGYISDTEGDQRKKSDF